MIIMGLLEEHKVKVTLSNPPPALDPPPPSPHRHQGWRQWDAFLSQLLGASRRVPPAVAVAEVIREKGPTRVQSPSAPKESPRTSVAVRCHRMRTSRCRTLSLRRRGEEGDGGTAPPAAARAQRFYNKYEHRPMISIDQTTHTTHYLAGALHTGQAHREHGEVEGWVRVGEEEIHRREVPKRRLNGDTVAIIKRLCFFVKLEALIKNGLGPSHPNDVAVKSGRSPVPSLITPLQIHLLHQFCLLMHAPHATLPMWLYLYLLEIIVAITSLFTCSPSLSLARTGPATPSNTMEINESQSEWCED
ncbi:unnamed protein product [Pleuronectes platessa]|uniref:Uncharacterized protein n=1 Tax=Pleuronectes platessa TaxID=8262 RepID=A0A9N7UAT7_PLEPL|nr:unnamed protein product [Pleuronectes platessa]